MQYLIGAFLLTTSALVFADHHETNALSPNVLATKAACEAFITQQLD